MSKEILLVVESVSNEKGVVNGMHFHYHLSTISRSPV
mgnify:CR=1 FL=1